MELLFFKCRAVKGVKVSCQISLPVPHFYSAEALVDGIIILYLLLSILSKFAEFYITIQLANENIELYQPQHQPSRSYRGFILKFDILLGFLKFAIWDKMNTLWYHKSRFNIKKCVTNLWFDQVWRAGERQKYPNNSLFWSGSPNDQRCCGFHIRIILCSLRSSDRINSTLGYNTNNTFLLLLGYYISNF